LAVRGAAMAWRSQGLTVVDVVCPLLIEQFYCAKTQHSSRCQNSTFAVQVRFCRPAPRATAGDHHQTRMYMVGIPAALGVATKELAIKRGATTGAAGGIVEDA